MHSMFYTKMIILPKGEIVDTAKLAPGDTLPMEFALYNVTYIRFFIYIFTVVCAKTIILWIFPTASK